MGLTSRENKQKEKSGKEDQGGERTRPPGPPTQSHSWPQSKLRKVYKLAKDKSPEVKGRCDNLS